MVAATWNEVKFGRKTEKFHLDLKNTNKNEYYQGF